jgi:hypothetical protein
MLAVFWLVYRRKTRVSYEETRREIPAIDPAATMTDRGLLLCGGW